MADSPVRRLTSIADRAVPIGLGEASTVFFSRGRLGEGESGVWEFWTAVDDRRSVTTRCIEGRDPGERFRAIETRPQDGKDSWEVASKAKLIRPATTQEVSRWLNSHPEDAPYAESGRIEGKTVRVDGTGDSYRVL